jgi:hypothetical protein
MTADDSPKETEDPEPETDESNPELEPKIAHHGAYLDETKLLLRTYVECESYDELRERVVEENVLNKNTDYYRKSVLREITRRYLTSKETYEQTSLMRLLTADSDDAVENWCLYYEFAQDPFISHVTQAYLYPEFERGTLTVQTEDIVPYLESIKDQYDGLREKTDTTIEEAASKYLAAMKNFGLLEGTQRKEFAITYIPDEAIAYIVYRLAEQGITTPRDVIEHEDWKLLLLDESDVRRRLRDITPAYVNYEKRGSTEQLTHKFESTEELINGF